MNILIPHKWLQDHLDTQADPQTIQTQLSLCGPAVERIYDKNNDQVYDIEVTTNRVDSMSVRGIAREAAVILDNAGFPSELKTLHLTESQPQSEAPKLSLPIIDNSSQLCQRITAVVLSGVEHSETPDWMAERLRQVDLNVKDVIIDITNYLAHDLGHPCHAFDYDKIMNLGGEIHVREAESGLPFTTLDGTSYETVGGEVVFVNAKGTIIDIPGIMGTANTAVDSNTKNVLFWIESIAPEKIRFTSMTHALRTPAAQLNERALDHNLATEVIYRGIELFQQLTNAQQASEVYSELTIENETRTLQFDQNELTRYLGVELSTQEVTSILEQLGCQIETTDNSTLNITLPSFRTDLSISADIVEEVARIYGYHNLPGVLMDTAIPTNAPKKSNFTLERDVEVSLAALGYQELYTYSLIGTELLERWNLDNIKHLHLRNPLTSDMEHMRQHILPSHVEATENTLEKSTACGTFELANVYIPQDGQLPDEHLVLAVMDTDFRQLRATLNFLANQLYLDRIVLKNSEENTKKDGIINPIFTSYAFITQDDKVLGEIGYLPFGRVGFELHWPTVLELSKRWSEYHSISKTAEYYEDWTVEIPNESPIGDVVETIHMLSKYIQKVEFLDQFENNWTFRITCLDKEKQFTNERGQELRKQAEQALQNIGAKIQ